ncbi:hypothetical protein Tempeh6L_06780 [Lactococcus lactis subsp. lactis]|uniref:hypothetical protein n=1 Tax=Lactococcus lactis TaxID=1358 RepID=UPI00300E2896
MTYTYIVNPTKLNACTARKEKFIIKQIKKTSDVNEANRLIEEGWVVVDLNLNEILLALHSYDDKIINQDHQ